MRSPRPGRRRSGATVPIHGCRRDLAMSRVQNPGTSMKRCLSSELVKVCAEELSAPAHRPRPRSICPISAGTIRVGAVPSSAPALSLRRREISAVGLRSGAGPTRRYAQTSIRDHPLWGRPTKGKSDGRRHSPCRATGDGPGLSPWIGVVRGSRVAARLNTPRFNHSCYSSSATQIVRRPSCRGGH
jgi:hypothetical protein